MNTVVAIRTAGTLLARAGGGGMSPRGWWCRYGPRGGLGWHGALLQVAEAGSRRSLWPGFRAAASTMGAQTLLMHSDCGTCRSEQISGQLLGRRQSPTTDIKRGRAGGSDSNSAWPHDPRSVGAGCGDEISRRVRCIDREFDEPGRQRLDGPADHRSCRVGSRGTVGVVVLHRRSAVGWGWQGPGWRPSCARAYWERDGSWPVVAWSCSRPWAHDGRADRLP